MTPRLSLNPSVDERAPLLAKLRAAGYLRVSRKFGLIARIDRPDWLAWSEANGEPLSADYYRRTTSRDVIQLPPDLALEIDSYGNDRPAYRPPGEIGRDCVLLCVDCSAALTGTSYGAGDGTGQRFRCYTCHHLENVRRRLKAVSSLPTPATCAVLQPILRELELVLAERRGGDLEILRTLQAQKAAETERAFRAAGLRFDPEKVRELEAVAEAAEAQEIHSPRLRAALVAVRKRRVAELDEEPERTPPGPRARSILEEIRSEERKGGRS